MADKYKCPKCGSGRTKPLSMAIAAGTRRRQTVGFSRRNLWTSASTYKSDLVRNLPGRPSNATAYALTFLGGSGFLFALFMGSADPHSTGFAILAAVVSLCFVLAGLGVRKSADVLSNEQAAWDDTWLCARCGQRWQA